jgi:hypothetical protein
LSIKGKEVAHLEVGAVRGSLPAVVGLIGEPAVVSASDRAVEFVLTFRIAIRCRGNGWPARSSRRPDRAICGPGQPPGCIFMRHNHASAPGVSRISHQRHHQTGTEAVRIYNAATCWRSNSGSGPTKVDTAAPPEGAVTGVDQIPTTHRHARTSRSLTFDLRNSRRCLQRTYGVPHYFDLGGWV